MCGISGLYTQTRGSIDPELVVSMNKLIEHRGPDDEGLWHDENVALGHRRLSIIDLSVNGHNPMPSQNRRYWIVFNGEVFNFNELKNGLIEDGYSFRNKTDTEVVVNLYDRYGIDFLPMLDGMFSLAIWDTIQKQLLIARDRCGVKPVYTAKIGDYFAFSSEIKAFMAIPGFKASPDPVGLSQYMSFQNMLGKQTLFSGVELLEAGHFMVVNARGVQKSRYWDLEVDPDYSSNKADRTKELLNVFKESVYSQLMSDRPVGSYLSGGMDTGSITSVASRHINRLHTFTCGFELPHNASDLEKYFDERKVSHQLAQELGTEHHVVTLDSLAMEPVLPKVTWHLDEPRVGISYQVYHTAKMVAEYVPVVMSGVGGDELFAGYPWRYETAKNLIGPTFDDAYYQDYCRLLKDDRKPDLFLAEFMKTLNGYTPREDFQNVLNDSQLTTSAEKALYTDFKVFMNGLLLVDDKLSMAHSVEARVPFLSNAMVEIARKIPTEWKLRDGKGKVVLRDAMNSLLPHEVIHRRKQGFTPPDSTWYKNESFARIEELILSDRALDRRLFDRATVRNILTEHVAATHNHRFLIWSLISLEWWHRLYVDGEWTKFNHTP